MDPTDNNSEAARGCPTMNPVLTLPGAAENMKLLFDTVMGLQTAMLKDNQVDARRREDNGAALDNLVKTNAAVITHLSNLQALTASQTGATANEQTVSPIRTGAADTEVQQPAGATYPPIRNVDQTGSTATGAVQTALAGQAVNAATSTGAILNTIVQSLAQLQATVAALAAGLVAAADKAATS